MSIAEQVAQLKQDFDDVLAYGMAHGSSGIPWDSVVYASRPSYVGAFEYWNIDKFEPTSRIETDNLQTAFLRMNDTSKGFSLEVMDGKYLPTTEMTNMKQAFYNCGVKNLNWDIKAADTVASSAFSYTFYLANKLHTIKSIEVYPSNQFDHTFDGCKALANIRFSAGTATKGIGNDISFPNSRSLTIESVESIASGVVQTPVQGKTMQFQADVNAKIIAKYGSIEAFATAFHLDTLGWTVAQ